MAKTKAQAHPVRRTRPHQADADRWNRILIVGGVIAVVLIAVGFIGFGWYQTQIRPLGKTVLTVGDTKYSLGHLQRRSEQLLNSNPSYEEPQQLLNLPTVMLDRMEFEGTLLETADELNLEVTDEEFAAEVRTRGNIAEDAEPEVFANEFRRQVDESGLHENEYRMMVRAEMLEQDMRNYFTFLAPAEEPQVRARWMVLASAADADEALQRVRAAEDFQAVAQDLSVDKSPIERDWSPRGSLVLPAEVEDFLFGDAVPGAVSDVISSADSFYVVELQERDDSRILDDNQKLQVGQREMTTWIVERNQTAGVRRDFTDKDLTRVLEELI